MPELIVQSGSQKGKRLVLPDGKKILVGRGEECRIRLVSSMVSRKHCLLRTTAGEIWVRDLSSQNGTYVNDQLIERPVRLEPGDVLRIGVTVFQVPGTKPPASETTEPHASESVLADWLSDEATPAAQDPDDTTILTRSEAASAVEAAAASHADETPPSDEDEAARIIRRHWEQLRASQQSGASPDRS